MAKSVYTARRRRQNKPVLIGIAALLIFLTVILVIRHVTEAPPAADSSTPPEETPAATAVSLPLPQRFVDQNTASSHIVLYDMNADKTLYSKKAEERCYPASMTKLLTAIVTVENAPADTVFTVGDEIRLIDAESSVAYLRIGHRLDLQTLLEAMLLPSGNDAAYVAAANVGRLIAGSSELSARDAIKVFCDKMNEKAASLGAVHSHFINPDGIHADNHYTTAADMLRIARAAYTTPEIAAVVREETVTRSFLSGETGMTWYNTNYLLRNDSRFYYEDATGLKTGSTDEAGYCLAASAEKNGVRLIAILMGAQTSDGRFEDAVGLFDVCFDAAAGSRTETPTTAQSAAASD